MEISLLQALCVFFVSFSSALFVFYDKIDNILESHPLSRLIKKSKVTQTMTEEEPGIFVARWKDDSSQVASTTAEEQKEGVSDTVSDDPVDISEELDIDSIKKEIESTCNFDTASEGVAALKNDPFEITDRLKNGFDLWEQRTGKKGMTYSEMREMFG